jgi:hypothetical protein
MGLFDYSNPQQHQYIESELSKKKDLLNYFMIQSNLCMTTTLGTGKKWSLFGGGRYSEGQTVKLINILIKIFHKNRDWGWN